MAGVYRNGNQDGGGSNPDSRVCHVLMVSVMYVIYIY